jgi:hypothetical protein
MKLISGFFQAATLLLAVAVLAGCATMSPNYEQPVVSLNYFRPAEAGGGFDIGLKILNPNREPLNLQGVVYTISLQGQDVIKGVGKGYAPIEGYSEANIELSAAPNLMAGIRLISEMMSQKEQQLEWEFEAKLDVGGLYPRIKVRETGEFDLGKTGNPL